jgi:hypothetical protein
MSGSRTVLANVRDQQQALVSTFRAEFSQRQRLDLRDHPARPADLSVCRRLKLEKQVIEIIKGLPSNVVGIAVNGRVTKKDCYEVLMPAMAKSLRRHDNIRLYYELNSRFPGAAWDDLDLGIEHVLPCERVAIVTDIGWIRYMVKALRFLIPGEIRVFATVQASEGRAWITATPGPLASAEASAPARRRWPRSRRPRSRTAIRWSGRWRRTG